MMAPSNGLMPTPPVPVSTQAGFYPQHQSPAAHSPHALPMNMSRSPNVGPGRPLLGNRQLSDANPGPHRGDNGWGDRDGGGRSQPFREDGPPVRMRSTSPSLRRGPPPMNDRRSGRDIEVAFHPLGEDVQMSRRPMDLNTVRHSPEQTRLALGLSTMDQPPPRSLHDRIQPAGSAAGPTSRDGPPVSSSDPPRNIDVYMSEPASRRRPPMFDETTEFASTSHARKPSLRERISDTGVSTANDAESNWNQVDVPMDVDASGDVHRGGGRGRFQQRRGNGRGRGYRR
ncbi:hypothetical protein BKA62DRAFT_707808 [Auriculariales sp. MPI-PUGE-AT-0066]|nr:hypothetical protein BKA62DRAFT_707808 [Auriculariales sp. MPI-PUGE-AT-0066]